MSGIKRIALLLEQYISIIHCVKVLGTDKAIPPRLVKKPTKPAAVLFGELSILMDLRGYF